MRLARAMGACGLLFVVAGSCTNDFDQFDFEGPQTTGAKPSMGGTMLADNSGGFGATPSGRGGRAGSRSDGGTGAVSGTGARGGTAGSSATGGGGTGGGGGIAGESDNGGEGPQGGGGAGAMSAGGAGASSCPTDQQECDGSCVSVAALEHCGSCEKACVPGFACEPTGCVCDTSEDCVAQVTGAGGNGGESAGGAAGDGQGGAASVSAQCVLGRCVCGATECGENQRCQADGSCG
jgi:hypothetical protein